MDENGPKIEDPFRRYRRLPEKPKRVGDSTARPSAQWNGPVPPPRASDVYPAQNAPVAPDPHTRFPVPEETQRHALLADVAADLELRKSGETPAGRSAAPQETPTPFPKSSGEFPVLSSRKSGEVPAAAASQDFIPPWKPSGEVAIPTSKNSGELSVHQAPRTSSQVIAPSRLGTGDPIAPKRNSGEFRAASRPSGAHRIPSSRPSGEMPAAATRTSGEFPSAPRRFSGDIDLSPAKFSAKAPEPIAPANPAERVPLAERKTKRRRNADPTAAGSWKGGVLLGTFSLALLAYAFNISTIQTVAENSLSNAAASNGFLLALLKILPWLLLIPVVSLFYAILRTLAGLIGLRKRSQRRRQRRRQKSPLDLFKSIANAQGVRSRVAYQGFTLLQPFLPEGHSLSPEDTLEGDLGMAPAQVRSLRLSLLARTDRDSDTGARLPPADTVLAMLLSAQQAPRRAPVPLQPVHVPGDPGRRR